jgi:hypothetical protein
VSWTIERRRRVAVVTMNTKVNAQNRTFFADLHDAFNRLEADYPESPVVLTGGPRVSAGLDLVASTSHCSPADDRRREASLRVPHRPPTGGASQLLRPSRAGRQGPRRTPHPSVWAPPDRPLRSARPQRWIDDVDPTVVVESIRLPLHTEHPTPVFGLGTSATMLLEHRRVGGVSTVDGSGERLGSCPGPLEPTGDPAERRGALGVELDQHLGVEALGPLLRHVNNGRSNARRIARRHARHVPQRARRRSESGGSGRGEPGSSARVPGLP